MSTLRAHVAEFHRTSKNSDAPLLVTPEASKLLRGLLRLTLQATADAAGIKRNRLKNFEDEGRPLSARDHRWLQAAFESAGAEIFMGQGKLQVTLDGEAIIENGERAEALLEPLTGSQCVDERWFREWSQVYMTSVYSGVPQCRISALERSRSKGYFLADQVALQSTFDAHPA